MFSFIIIGFDLIWNRIFNNSWFVRIRFVTFFCLVKSFIIRIHLLWRRILNQTRLFLLYSWNTKCKTCAPLSSFYQNIFARYIAQSKIGACTWRHFDIFSTKFNYGHLVRRYDNRERENRRYRRYIFKRRLNRVRHFKYFKCGAKSRW